MKRKKYAFYHVGSKRQTLSKEELHRAIDQAFNEQKQRNFLFGFSIVELTEDELKHEKENYDKLDIVKPKQLPEVNMPTGIIGTIRNILKTNK